MTKQEILEWLEGEVQGYPDRATGNECGQFITRLASRVVESDRCALVEAMREWIVQRGNRTLLAMNIATDLKLRELKPDIERLLEDVRANTAFSPYYEEFITPALKRIEAA
jgi:hypothetical protein